MCIVYSLNPSLYCTGQAGHGRANFIGKDDNCDSTLTIYMNCLSMDVAYNPRLKKYNPRYCTETDKGFTFWLDLSVPVLGIRISTLVWAENYHNKLQKSLKMYNFISLAVKHYPGIRIPTPEIKFGT